MAIEQNQPSWRLVFGYRQLPNQVTLLRLILAVAFFVVLDQYQRPNEPAVSWWLVMSVLMFVIAALTDSLDGYLARRWRVESQFGRIMDPLCDKVLILGAFIFLAGPRFLVTGPVQDGGELLSISGVHPWMVVVMLIRELLVTGIRGQLEGRGVHFSARSSGKLKMVIQSISIPLVLIIIGLDPLLADRTWLLMTRDLLVYIMVGVTVVSGLPYVAAAVRAVRSDCEVN